MSRRPTISLFPFLNVMLGVMGVLAFLAVTLPLFGLAPERAAAPKPENLVTTPPLRHSEALWIECTQTGVVVHEKGVAAKRIDLSLLRKEAAVLQKVLERLGDPLEPGPEMEKQRQQVLQQLNRSRLYRGFTAAMISLELQNLKALQAGATLRHPVLAVQPNGLEAYSITWALLRTATKLRPGLEPLWSGRKPPWQKAGKS